MISPIEIMPTSLLIFCLDYTKNSTSETKGVFATVRSVFLDLADTGLQEQLQNIYDFRNQFVAHTKSELADSKLTRTALKEWISGLVALQRAKGHSSEKFEAEKIVPSS